MKITASKLKTSSPPKHPYKKWKRKLRYLMDFYRFQVTRFYKILSRNLLRSLFVPNFWSICSQSFNLLKRVFCAGMPDFSGEGACIMFCVYQKFGSVYRAEAVPGEPLVMSIPFILLFIWVINRVRGLWQTPNAEWGRFLYITCIPLLQTYREMYDSRFRLSATFHLKWDQ